MMQNQWSHFMHFPEDFGGSLEWTKLSTGLFCFHIWIKFNNRKRYIQQAKSKLCKLTRQNLWFYGLPSSEQVMLNTISHGGLMFCQQHWRWITICTTDTFSQLKLLFQLYLTQILSSLPILSNNFSLLNCYHAIVYPQKPEMLACLLPSPWPLHQLIMEGILRFPINLSEIQLVSSLKSESHDWFTQKEIWLKWQSWGFSDFPASSWPSSFNFAALCSSQIFLIHKRP
jgi:hypothetical protein